MTLRDKPEQLHVLVHSSMTVIRVWTSEHWKRCTLH